MNTKPILRNTQQVQAILNGATQMRFVLNPQPKYDKRYGFAWKGIAYGPEIIENGQLNDFMKWRAPYQPGDILYVRETFTKEWGRYYFRADFESDYLDPCETLSGGYPESCTYHPGCEGCMRMPTRIIWSPSIHMPKEAARIFLRVTDVRAERLQDIRPVDVVNEGLYEDCRECLDTYSSSGKQCCYREDDECSICDSVITTYVFFWNGMIKPEDLDRYGWDANPWVWVIQFERISKEEALHEYSRDAISRETD